MKIKFLMSFVQAFILNLYSKFWISTEDIKYNDNR